MYKSTDDALTLTAFRAQVMSEINSDWESLGSMVIKAWNAPTEPIPGKRPVVIKWHCSVNGIAGFMKSDDTPLLTHEQFEDWKWTAVNCSGRTSTVTIKMDKPVSEVQRSKAVRLIHCPFPSTVTLTVDCAD